MGNLGNCVNTNFSILLQNNEGSQGLYDSVLKCPERHWLAFFETSTCTECKKKGQVHPARISCIECSFGLCVRCFTRKFERWEKHTQRINPSKADELRMTLKQELDEYIKSKKQEDKCTTLKRLESFLSSESQKHISVRAEKEISLESSLELRIVKVTSLCENVYKLRAAA